MSNNIQQKSKLTLIIDGNWLLMSRLGVLMSKYDDDELYNNLKLLIIKSIKVALKSLPGIDNIIFVADGGGSWRNEIEIPKFLNHDELGKEVEYKGTREKSQDIDWDKIFAAYDELFIELESNGIHTYKEKNIEGDDWCWYFSNSLNENNINCIIWTSDNDLKQLVKMNKDNCFVGWWNSNNGIYLSDYNEDDIDFLFNINYNDNKQVLNNLLLKISNVNKISPKTIIIEKILRGDMSDNIFPIFLKKSNSNSTKTFRLYKTDINYDLNINDDNNVKSYIHDICENKKYKNKLLQTESNIFEHFNYNKHLIVLDKQYYPNEILECFNNIDHEYIYKIDDLSQRIYNIEAKYLADQYKISNILNII